MLIKFFSGIDDEYVRQVFKDQTEAEKLIQSYRKRSIVASWIVSSFILVSFIAIGYALNASYKTDEEVANLEPVQEQIDQCITNTQKQAEDASKSKAQAEQINKEIQLRLEECERKQNKK